MCGSMTFNEFNVTVLCGVCGYYGTSKTRYTDDSKDVDLVTGLYGDRAVQKAAGSQWVHMCPECETEVGTTVYNQGFILTYYKCTCGKLLTELTYEHIQRNKKDDRVCPKCSVEVKYIEKKTKHLFELRTVDDRYPINLAKYASYAWVPYAGKKNKDGDIIIKGAKHLATETDYAEYIRRYGNVLKEPKGTLLYKNKELSKERTRKLKDWAMKKKDERFKYIDKMWKVTRWTAEQRMEEIGYGWTLDGDYKTWNPNAGILKDLDPKLCIRDSVMDLLKKGECISIKDSSSSCTDLEGNYWMKRKFINEKKTVTLEEFNNHPKWSMGRGRPVIDEDGNESLYDPETNSLVSIMDEYLDLDWSKDPMDREENKPYWRLERNDDSVSMYLDNTEY